MFIDYTATRELVGSGADEIDTDAGQIDRSQKRFGSESVSLSGVGREYQLDRLEFTWTVTTIPVPVTDLPRWREFAASVANGETFSFDPYGSKASPDNVLTVSLVDGSYQENRFSSTYMQISFAAIER